MKQERHEYVLDLVKGPVAQTAELDADGVDLLVAEPSGRSALAALMLDAYRGTIDYEGETLDEARQEVDRYYAAEPLVSASTLATLQGNLASACLAGLWPERGCPLIWYVMTAAAAKNRGLGRLVLSTTLQRLRSEGHREVRAIITDGNKASEAVFHRLGFRRLAGSQGE